MKVKKIRNKNELSPKSGVTKKPPEKKVLKPIIKNDSVAIKSTSDSLKIDSLKSVNLSKIVPSK